MYGDYHGAWAAFGASDLEEWSVEVQVFNLGPWSNPILNDIMNISSSEWDSVPFLKLLEKSILGRSCADST